MFHTCANRRAMLTGLFAGLAMVAGSIRPSWAQNTQDSVRLLLRWVDTKPDESLANFVVFLGFHNGQFDSFDLGQPVDPLVAEWLPRGFNPATDFVEAFETRFVGAKGTWIWNPNPDTLSFPSPSTQPWVAVADVDPQRHRFLSYLSRLTPANDAFIGNEDPFQIEVFDVQGRFRGPLYVDVYGNQVIDAGLCGNDEARLTGLDVALYEEQQCQSGEGHARLHPGLNGSYRNASGMPQRILGGETYYLNPGQTHFRRYDEIGADFSRPGHKLGRLIVSRWTATGNWSGSWYSPERSGEGFNVEILEPDAGNPRARILVYWYTYTPDGSGEQVWLTGVGEFDADNGLAANVPLHYTEGGRFASPLNPGLVERRPWGSIRIRFEWSSCTDGRVHWFPDDPAWPTGDYAIHRLSPQIEGLGWVCRPGDAQLVLPDD